MQGMSQPGPQEAAGSLDEAAQQQLIQEIGRTIVQALPPGWQEARVEYRAVGEHYELVAQLQAPNGTVVPLAPPVETAGHFQWLRHGMYHPDRGTWVSALYQLRRPGSYTVDFNGDQEPAWHTAPPPQAYADELRRYPRPAESTPEWLSRQASGAATAELRTATVFDENGQPVTTHPELAPQERDLVLEYLNRAPVVLAARSYDTDRLDPSRNPAVPMTFHTDGTWIWPGAAAYYLREHGVPPQPELVEHIRRQEFQVPPVDEPTRERAVSIITTGQHR